MSTSAGAVLEGLIGIHKPTGLTSAGVIRSLQQTFKPSTAFAPYFASEVARRGYEKHNQKQKRRGNKKKIEVKMGHGGTLDPLASGVLVCGIGSGTKKLQGFLECTKEYETLCVFGTETDTYDVLGKILGRKSTKQVSRAAVEKVLKEKFTGKIMQKPPIFSALKVEGKKLYEYAREGKEPPREIVARAVTAEVMEVMEWVGEYDGKVPEEEAEDVEKKMVSKLGVGVETDNATEPKVGEKRARSTGAEESDAKKMKHDTARSPSPDNFSTPLTSPRQSPAPTSSSRPPAVRLRMTVTSGFYVRSLIHDLGRELGSAAYMAELVRTRQGDYALGGDNCVEWAAFEDEKVWGPQLGRILGEGQGLSEGQIKRVPDGEEANDNEVEASEGAY